MFIFPGFYTYDDNYSEENYEYNEEVEVEEEADFVPVFESSPMVYRVRRGNTARLECKVDNLGPMILSWRRLINNSSAYIATGSILMERDKRFSVLTSTTSSMLLITLMTPKDTGEYVCEVSSTPPVHIKHWLKMKGTLPIHDTRYTISPQSLPAWQYWASLAVDSLPSSQERSWAWCAG